MLVVTFDSLAYCALCKISVVVDPCRKGNPDKGFQWTFHFFVGLEDFANVYSSLFARAGLGSQVEVETDGAQEQEAVEALLALIDDKFGEGE